MMEFDDTSVENAYPEPRPPWIRSRTPDWKAEQREIRQGCEFFERALLIGFIVALVAAGGLAAMVSTN